MSGGDRVLSEKAANCSLLAGRQPNAGGSEAALRLEDGKSGGGTGQDTARALVGRAWSLPAFLLGVTSWGSSSAEAPPPDPSLGEEATAGSTGQAREKSGVKGRRRSAPTGRA